MAAVGSEYFDMRIWDSLLASWSLAPACQTSKIEVERTGGQTPSLCLLLGLRYKPFGQNSLKGSHNTFHSSENPHVCWDWPNGA